MRACPQTPEAFVSTPPLTCRQVTLTVACRPDTTPAITTEAIIMVAQAGDTGEP
jgi:hypothetical protein